MKNTLKDKEKRYFLLNVELLGLLEQINQMFNVESILIHYGT